MKHLLDEKIENIVNIKNIEFDKNDLNQFLLEKEHIYKYENLKNYIYDALLEFDNSRLYNFIRNIKNNHPNKNKTYEHLINDIQNKLKEKYNLPNEYYIKNRNELDDLSDKYLLEENYFMLFNIRKLINDKFKINNFEGYIKENRNQAIKTLKKLGKDITDKDYIRIENLLKNKPGYIGIFTYFLFKEKIPFIRLKNLYNDKIKKYEDIVNQLNEPIANYNFHKLPYKTKEGRTYQSHFERLEDDLTFLIDAHQAKLYSNKYPLAIRKGLENNKDYIQLINDLKEDKVKVKYYEDFFLRKIARYKNTEDFLKAFKNFIYSLDDKEEIRERIKGDIYSDIVYDDGDFLVFRNRAYECSHLISDTSWCLATSLDYWNDYINSDGDMFLALMNFKEKDPNWRKIGVALYNNGGFKTAHLKNDQFVSEIELNKYLRKNIDMDLKELYNLGSYFGSNKEYDSEDFQSDRYRW